MKTEASSKGFLMKILLNFDYAYVIRKKLVSESGSPAALIDLWNDPLNGRSEDLSEDDKARLDSYRKTDPVDQELLWVCEIRSTEFCNGIGRKEYLLNRSRTTNYIVIIETRWTYKTDRGSYQRTYRIDAGARINLGCTDNGANSPTRYFRSIVNERPSD